MGVVFEVNAFSFSRILLRSKRQGPQENGKETTKKHQD